MVRAASRILIPVDFGEPSIDALRTGYAFAQRLKAPVHVVHAAFVPPVVDSSLTVQVAADASPTTVEALVRRTAQNNLNALLRLHPPPEEVDVTHEVVKGEPLPVVGQLSRRFDLIVVGTHGRTGLDRWFVGSVAERVVRHVDRPILVARNGPETIRRILVPIDFSPASRAAVSYAVNLAQCFEAEVRLLHVIPSIPALEQAELLVVTSEEQPAVSLYEHARWRAQKDLWAFLAKVEEVRGFAVDIRLGDPAEEIVEAARAHSTDLVVMGTHGATDWAWVGVGSVAEQVVRRAPCAVLTTRWDRYGEGRFEPTEPAADAFMTSVLPQSSVGGGRNPQSTGSMVDPAVGR